VDAQKQEKEQQKKTELASNVVVSARNLNGIDVKSQHLLNGAITPQSEDYEIMSRVASFESSRIEDIYRQKSANFIAKFQSHVADCGAIAIQVAMLTERIRKLGAHMVEHRRDRFAILYMRRLLSRRRSFFLYLKRTDFPTYEKMIHACQVKESQLNWK